MRRITILDTKGKELDQSGVLRRIWLRSKNAPHLVACAEQHSSLVARKALETWKIAALKPVALDEYGIPAVFQFSHLLERPEGEGLATVFSYTSMMDRLEHNYGSRLPDPLKRVTNHYEEERLRRTRGTVTREHEQSTDSLSHELWARKVW